MAENEQSNAQRQKLVPVVPAVIHEGKDEMNFAEFPLGIISKRSDPKVNTLVFEDSITDRSTGQVLKRKLTITTSDLLGLPTSTDDEVLLGLIQLSKLQGFASRKVYFTRYQLVRLLGWPVNGQNYDRIKKALERWSGITLLYAGAWRDQGAGRWGDGTFHVLDNMDLDPSENESTRPKPSLDQLPFEYAASYFIWNEKVFQSFQNGNLKSLDFSFLMDLKSAISRRLYRFLDKRLYRLNQIEFDLKTLAFEKIAMSRNTAIGDLKRQIGAAMDELTEVGFLKKLTQEERFQKIGIGSYRVLFVRASEATSIDMQVEVEQQELPLDVRLVEKPPIEKALIEAGVKGPKVHELASNHPAEFIAEKLEVLAVLLAKKARQVEDNPAGFLIRSIQENYDNPKGFVSSAQKARVNAEKRAGVAKQAEAKKKAEADLMAKNDEEEKLIASYWAGLSVKERAKQEKKALTKAKTDFEREHINNELVRSSLLWRHALAELKRAKF